MKKLLAAMFLISAPALAQTRTPLMKEAEALGALAGAASACNAGRPLQKYEYMAGRILVNKAPTAADENRLLRIYMQNKLNADSRQRTVPAMRCEEFLSRFADQEIMRFTAYPDGSLRKPDGSWILPRGQTKPPKVRS